MNFRTPIKILFIIAGVQFTSLKAQDCIVLANGDSIRCSSLTYEVNMNGRITDLTYKDKKGKKVEIHEKKEIPEISSMTLSGKTFDLLPVNLKKPDGKYYIGERLVDGKLKVSLYNSRHSITNPAFYNHGGTRQSEAPMTPTKKAGKYLFYIKLEDNTFYKITNSNIKKFIKPILLQCEKFKNNYQGKYKATENLFVEMIKLYNASCANN